MTTPTTSAAPPLSHLGRYFEISLYLMLLVSVLTLVSTGKLDLVSILLPPAALMVKGYRWWRGREPELSNRAATFLVIAYFAFFPLDLGWVSRMLATGAQNPGLYSALLATIHLMLYAMIVRLFSARTTRDYLFLAMLAFSAMLASAILTVDTAFLAFLAVFLALGVSTFIGLEMRRSAEGAVSPPIASRTLSARRLHTALGITSAAIAVAALIIGTGIFFVIPRVHAGYLSSFNLQPSLISGFSDDVELGEIGEIKKSSAVVMRIKVQGDPLLAQDVHWRGVALTSFDGHRWYTEAHESMAMSQGADGWVSLNAPTPDDNRYAVPLSYTVFLEPIGSDALFVAGEPQRVRGQFVGDAGPGSGRAMSRTYLVVDKTGSLSNPFHNFMNIRYDAVSELQRIPPATLRAASTEYPDAVHDLYLQLPRIDPRVLALAKQITAGAHNPYDQARSIEAYLHTHYGYTLDLSGPAQADPLAHFLFEKRAGHCEYFATAMTVMMRSLGVPARYINGFLPGEYNDVGGDYIIRARDAHSWVEVYFPGYGWLTFDPTPPSNDRSDSLLSNLGYYWDWFQLQWGEWVINYDFFHQYTLAQGLQRVSRNGTAELRAAFEKARDAGTARIRDWQARITAAPRWLTILLAALIGAVLCLRSRSLRERWMLAWRLGTSRGSAPDARRLTLLSPHVARAGTVRLA